MCPQFLVHSLYFVGYSYECADLLLTYEHIRCPWLQPEGDLSSLLVNLSNNTGGKVLLLINNEDYFFIHQSLLVKNQVSVYPVLVTASGSGKVLTHIFGHKSKALVLTTYM